jgi:FtsP/CotA-like multicopper oxidase with cupredoxin domain
MIPLSPPDDTLPRVHPNDNRMPAGRLRGDTLELQLEVRMARWFPEADSGEGLEVAAFTEAGRAPEIPAPLIRVPAGTTIIATIRNVLSDSTIAIHGLLTHPATADDSLFLSPGEARTITFPAGEPGSYTYWATFGTARHRRGR